MELFTNLEKRRKLLYTMFWCFIAGILVDGYIAYITHR